MAITVEEFANAVWSEGSGYAVTNYFSEDALESISDVALRDAAIAARHALRFIEDDLYTKGLLG